MPSGGRREKNSLNPDPDYVRSRMKQGLYLQSLPRVDVNDPEAIRARIKLYFDNCMESGIRPGVEGLCLALHINRETLMRWASGERRKGQEHQQIAQDARQFLANLMEQYMTDGEINPVAGIFLASNNFGYDRNATMTLQVQQALSNPDEDPKKLAEKYAADAIDVEATPVPLKIESKE